MKALEGLRLFVRQLQITNFFQTTTPQSSLQSNTSYLFYFTNISDSIGSFGHLDILCALPQLYQSIGMFTRCRKHIKTGLPLLSSFHKFEVSSQPLHPSAVFRSIPFQRREQNSSFPILQHHTAAIQNYLCLYAILLPF